MARPRRSRRLSYDKLNRMCREKVRYPTSGMAQAKADKLGLRTYPCLRCGGWHLTSKGDVL